MKFKDITNHTCQACDFIFDLIFPKECAGCGQESSWLCPDCFSKLKFSSEQYCFHCKKLNKTGSFCSTCQNDYFLDGVIIAGNYDDKILSRLIKMLKYNFVKDIGNVLGNYLTDFLKSYFDNEPNHKSKIINLKSIIIPVPLHPRRLRWRGFNQTETIANVVAQNFQLEIITKKLIRTKHKKAQAKLDEWQRLKNIKDCFAWHGDNLAGATIILVDDVATTGATLNECAKILKQNGANQVWGLVVAKG